MEKERNTCDDCNQDIRDGFTVTCNNSCLTYICPKCNKEWYYNESRRLVGHSPDCGTENQKFRPRSPLGSNDPKYNC